MIRPGKDNCCGREACSAICPKGAIDMREDAEGFRYPHVREDACVRCGLCEQVCPLGAAPGTGDLCRRVWTSDAAFLSRKGRIRSARLPGFPQNAGSCKGRIS